MQNYIIKQIKKLNKQNVSRETSKYNKKSLLSNKILTIIDLLTIKNWIFYNKKRTFPKKHSLPHY